MSSFKNIHKVASKNIMTSDDHEIYVILTDTLEVTDPWKLAIHGK